MAALFLFMMSFLFDCVLIKPLIDPSYPPASTWELVSFEITSAVPKPFPVLIPEAGFLVPYAYWEVILLSLWAFCAYGNAPEFREDIIGLFWDTDRSSIDFWFKLDPEYRDFEIGFALITSCFYDLSFLGLSI